MIATIQQLYDCFKHWGSKGAVWIISDTHFGDEALKRGMPLRPSDEDLIKIINSKVGKNDYLIHLGDVGDLECAKRLKGHKVLIKGNHDSGASNYKEIFEEVYEGPVFISKKILLSHEPINFSGAVNIHGHIHDSKHKNDKNHYNVCCDVINYTPINLNQWIKQGYLNKIFSIHRSTINEATERKKNKKKVLSY